MGLDGLVITPSNQPLPSLESILAHVDNDTAPSPMPVRTLYLCPGCDAPWLYDYEARECCGNYGVATRVWQCAECGTCWDYEQNALDCCDPELQTTNGYVCKACEYAVSIDDLDAVYPDCENCGHDNSR